MGAVTIVLFCALAGISAAAVVGPVAVFPEIARAQSPDTRIVSGWEAAEGQIPFQLSIRMVNSAGGVSSCGGTIIHPDWGLTAAHCTAGRVSLVIRAGAVNLTRPEILFETTEYYLHPNYNGNQPSVVQPDDVSLIKFGRTLVYSDRVNQVRLQPSFDRNRDYSGERLVASGWGRTWTNGESPENMNWVYLTAVSNRDCRNEYGGSSIIQDSTICARYYNVTSQSTCQGDSGGPLAIEDRDGELTHLGVASFVSAAGCHVELSAGFVRSGHYHAWYTEVTGVNFDWEEPEAPTTVPVPSTTEEPELPSTVDVPTEGPELPSTVDVPTTEGPELPSTVDVPTTEGPELPSTVNVPTTEGPEVDGPTTEGPEVPSTADLPDLPSTIDMSTTEAPEYPTTVDLTTPTSEKPEYPTVAPPPTTEEPETEETTEETDETSEETDETSEETDETSEETEEPEVPTTVGLPETSSTTVKPEVTTEEPDLPEVAPAPLKRNKVEFVETGKQQEIFDFVRKFWYW